MHDEMTEVILRSLTTEWKRMSTLAQLIKGKRVFAMDYSAVIRGMHTAEREGRIEIKKVRENKQGPLVGYVRIKS